MDIAELIFCLRNRVKGSSSLELQMVTVFSTYRNLLILLKFCYMLLVSIVIKYLAGTDKQLILIGGYEYYFDIPCYIIIFWRSLTALSLLYHSTDLLVLHRWLARGYLTGHSWRIMRVVDSESLICCHCKSKKENFLGKKVRCFLRKFWSLIIQRSD